MIRQLTRRVNAVRLYATVAKTEGAKYSSDDIMDMEKTYSAKK
jgi:hypothetical protein